MGLLDKLITGGGVVLIGAAARRIYRDAQETRRRKNSPLCFDEGLTQSEFIEIARDAAKRMPRVEDIVTTGMTVNLYVRSNSGLSTWKVEIDFNDYGHLTGKYWLDTENSDSLIPKHFAEAVQEQIGTVRSGRTRQERSKRNRSSGASEAGSRAATAERATLSSIGSSQSRVRVLPAPAAAAPAGWYVDASDATRLRYWDGTAWTDHFAPTSRTAAAPHAPAPPPSAVPAGWYPDPEGLGQRWWDGVMWGAPALIPSAMDISNLTFTRTLFPRGYDEQDVDECLDLIAANLALPLAQRTLRPEEVLAVRFRATQFGFGYDAAEVDDVLDQLAVDLGLP